MSNNRMNVMKKLARQLWGDINAQRTITKGVTWFSCSGHGGYVVDTDLYPDLKEYNDTVETRKYSGYINLDEQHFASFEEDCCWSILEYLHPEIAEIKFKKLIEPEYDDVTFTEYFEDVLSSIKRHHPGLLKEDVS